MENYHWAMFTHAMDFFPKCARLKTPIQEHFFTSLLQDLSMEDLVSLGNFLSIKFMKLNRRLYVTLGKRTWVPQDLRNKMLKQLVNHQMIGLALKPQDVYNSKKKKKIEEETKIPLFATIFCSLDILI
jgi:hypothetical protein